MKAKGPFDVDLKPIDAYASGKFGNTLGRMSIDKTFKGDLSGTSQGEMLSAMTATEGSAGYVAIEQVDVELMGKKGGFVLQHFGLMAGGSDSLVLDIVPDSGSGDLIGISGSMKIIREEGQHFYELDYELG